MRRTEILIGPLCMHKLIWAFIVRIIEGLGGGSGIHYSLKI